jgi:hypothetical protein
MSTSCKKPDSAIMSNSPVHELKSVWEERLKKNERSDSTSAIPRVVERELNHIKSVSMNDKLINEEESDEKNQKENIIESTNDVLTDSTTDEEHTEHVVDSEIDIDKLHISIEDDNHTEWLNSVPSIQISTDDGRRESSYEEIPVSPSLHMNVFGVSMEQHVDYDQVEVPLAILALIAVIEARIYRCMFFSTKTYIE